MNTYAFPPGYRLQFSSTEWGSILGYFTTGDHAGQYYVQTGWVEREGSRPIPKWRHFYPSQLEKYNPVQGCSEKPVETEYFYVAVTKNGQPDPKPGNIVLAAGPFDTLNEALLWYEPVKRLVREKYDDHGMSHWYGYSTVGIKNHNTPGKLNAELGIGLIPTASLCFAIVPYGFWDAPARLAS